jgi:hypothetical protein
MCATHSCGGVCLLLLHLPVQKNATAHEPLSQEGVGVKSGSKQRGALFEKSQF